MPLQFMFPAAEKAFRCLPWTVTLSVVAAETSPDPPETYIHAEAAGHSPAFVPRARDLSHRERTAARAFWQPGAWATGRVYHCRPGGPLQMEYVCYCVQGGGAPLGLSAGACGPGSGGPSGLADRQLRTCASAKG